MEREREKEREGGGVCEAEGGGGREGQRRRGSRMGKGKGRRSLKEERKVEEGKRERPPRRQGWRGKGLEMKEG